MSPRPCHARLLSRALLLFASYCAPFPGAAAGDTPPAAPTAAAEPDVGQPAAVAAATEQCPAPARFLTVPLDQLTPMQQEIRLRIEREQLELAGLSAAYATATSDDEAQALQKQIHAVKTGAERAVLRIQLAYARAEGRQESVVHLEQALAVLERGSVERQPADRPPPGDAQR